MGSIPIASTSLRQGFVWFTPFSFKVEKLRLLAQAEDCLDEVRRTKTDYLIKFFAKASSGLHHIEGW
jgi:hypothetical protein